jgi:leucyl/phenylalanyl-tRNA--protein transferase
MARITQEIKDAYLKTTSYGIVQSVEVWQNSELVGGLYGIYLKEKNILCEKACLVKVRMLQIRIYNVRKKNAEGVSLIDCQIYTEYLNSLGSPETPRKDFFDLEQDQSKI